MVVRWVAVLAVGIVLLLISAPFGESIVVPGPTTFQHGDIGDCATCHSNEHSGVNRWVLQAFESRAWVADSALCLDCHNLGAYATRAHGLAVGTLVAATSRIGALPSDPTDEPPAHARIARAVLPVPGTDVQLACNTCHREHQGKRFDLTEIDDLKCQSCHVKIFSGFAQGHPPFSDFPYPRRTRLIFDHASHIGKHFKAENTGEAPTSCTGCHKPDTTGTYMTNRPFETACASCHEGDIRGSARGGRRGLPFLAVPGLDVDVLQERGFDIGQWPYYADNPISPFLRFLLSGDAQSRLDLDRVGGLDLLDLADATQPELEAVVRLAWRFKALVQDLAVNGHGALALRLGTILNRSIPTIESTNLIGKLPADTLLQAQEEWFPNLSYEMSLPRRESPSPAAASITGQPAAPASPKESAPEPEAVDEEIFADESLGGLFSEDSGDGGDELDLGALLGPSAPTDENDGDLGGLLEDLGTDDDSLGGLLGEGGLFGEEEGSIEETGETVPAVPPTPVEIIPLDSVLEPIEVNSWMEAGGWYREAFALVYRPGNHEDAFIRSWIELTRRPTGIPAKPAAQALFANLSKPKSIGACVKCHSVDALNGDALEVNWRSQPPTPEDHRFSRFAHAPHFSLLDEKGCLTCHVLAPDAAYQESFKQTDPTRFTANFEPMQKEQCSKCHVQELAGARCTDCHNYHIGRLLSLPQSAPLSSPQNEPDP